MVYQVCVCHWYGMPLVCHWYGYGMVWIHIKARHVARFGQKRVSTAMDALDPRSNMASYLTQVPKPLSRYAHN